MALNGLFCADVTLKNSLTHSAVKRAMASLELLLLLSAKNARLL